MICQCFENDFNEAVYGRVCEMSLQIISVLVSNWAVRIVQFYCCLYRLLMSSIVTHLGGNTC